ncbi:MAG: methionine--tRNA ligase [Chlamydiales bacterium]|nr:methionine--tRNA ligase [Chlamydiia bacterium]MCP5507281.1 methionine--tRNA ligase [Chlamydiales bacterium]
MTKEKVLITSALPYANGPLHFGHIAGAYLPGDCYARFERLKGSDVLYICGSDEYGVAITLNAEKEGRTPQEHVDIYHHVIKNFFDQLNISFDHYSRTTNELHATPAYQYFNDLLKNGYIEEKVTDQLYSEDDGRFLADRYVEGTCPKCGFENARGDECQKCGASYEATDLINPRSKLTGAALVRKPTKHWFLLLDKFKERLLEWLETKNWKPNVTNFIKGYINDLHPRAITRDSNWGLPVPLPNTEGKVLYVWFDAPIGYISATMEWAKLKGNEEQWRDYWCDSQTKLVNFIGKDNIPFHAAIFPAMTMGQNQPYKLVDELPANEFYKLEGRQFSKSEGWYIDLEDFFKRYTADQIRYAIAANAPETADSEFTWKDFQLRCNTDLLGKYGNLVNRVMVFAHKQCDGKIPPVVNLETCDKEFLASIKKLTDEIADCYAHFKVRKASQLVMELAQLGNVYFDSKQPWKDVKQEETRPRMETTIFCCFECLKLLALASFPIIPESAGKIWNMIGNTSDLAKENWDSVTESTLVSGQQLKKAEILFRKIEDEEVEQEVAKLHTHVNEATETKIAEFLPVKESVAIEDFQKIDLRVAVIKEATAVKKSKKLLKLKVDLGFEERTVLSGISLHYKPEDLIGKRVILVANLKPAKLMGIESQGMILAGTLNDHLEIVTLDNLPAGSIVS